MYIKSEKLLQFENEYESYSYNPISCNICYKTFAAKSTLQLHIEIHHETNSNTEKEIQNYKDSKIIKEIVFVKSEQKDMEDENFIVNECDSQENDCSIQKYIHTGERSETKFECKQCHIFISKDNSLQKHLNPNTCGRCIGALRCTKCHELFGMKNILSNHLKHFKAESFKIHFKCMVCQKSFSPQSNSKKHIWYERVNRYINLKINMFHLVITDQNKIFAVF